MGMWQGFADQREKFIGGTLEERGEEPTVITDIEFDGSYFTVRGKDYDCCIGRKYGAMHVEDGWFVISGPYLNFQFKGKDD